MIPHGNILTVLLTRHSRSEVRKHRGSSQVQASLSVSYICSSSEENISLPLTSRRGDSLEALLYTLFRGHDQRVVDFQEAALNAVLMSLPVWWRIGAWLEHSLVQSRLRTTLRLLSGEAWQRKGCSRQTQPKEEGARLKGNMKAKPPCLPISVGPTVACSWDSWNCGLSRAAGILCSPLLLDVTNRSLSWKNWGILWDKIVIKGWCDRLIILAFPLFVCQWKTLWEDSCPGERQSGRHG